MSVLAKHLISDGWRRTSSVLTWLVIALLWPLHHASVLADESEAVQASDTIVLGRVSNNPRKHYAALDALGNYLVQHSDDFVRHETRLAKDNHEMIELLRAGKIDLVSETAFSAIQYERLADAEILLRQWKGGQASYKTVFFARKDSDIQRLQDLAGHLIAFEDSGSTSGYFVPKATIANLGMPLKFAEKPRGTTDVGYLFADSEVNVVAWVARDKVDVGVTSNLHWNDTSRAPLGLKRQLRIFHTTPDIIRSVMIAGPRLNEVQRDSITRTLLSMHESDGGQVALEAFYKTTRFDSLVDDAKDSLDHVRALYDHLGDTPPL